MMTHPQDLRSSPPDAYNIAVITDGTNTVAEIIALTEFGAITIGRGESRRRRGDKRNSVVGQTLALKRALKEAEKGCDNVLKRHGGWR